MKNTVKEIKMWGVRDWLSYFTPKPFSYIGDFLDYILPRYSYNWYDKIRCTLKPRQRWIKKHIEYKQWCDKVELIPKFLFGCVVHFVEEEKCFERIDWEASSPQHAKVADKLQECYEYITTARPALEQQLDDAYDNLPEGGSYEEIYADVISTEKAIVDGDKKYMMWIVKNKDYLWV